MELTLSRFIQKKNEEYSLLNDKVEQSETIEELTENRAIKRQFMHDYAQELNDFIWNHLSELTPKTCVVFDLVPYTIWNVMSEKYTTIIDKIKELHQEEV
ncbi:MAG: hypothetical protein D8H99_23210 [Streptococcus sp.]|nr:MAG: hypothetical protein D8H99_23210 [Streptococcus sp.]